MRTSKTEIEYSTQESLQRLLDASRAGFGPQIDAVEGGYLRLTEPMSDKTKAFEHVMPAIIIRGARGRAQFTGFSWGYGGGGPHGLSLLLQFLGVDGAWAKDLAMNQLTDSNEPKLSEFENGKRFKQVWQLDWSALTAKKRTDTLPTDLLNCVDSPVGVAIDHIVHRQLPNLCNRNAFAKVVGCKPCVLSRHVSGERPTSLAFGKKWSAALTNVPDMLVSDLSFLCKACEVSTERDTKEKRKRRMPKPSVADLQLERDRLRNDLWLWTSSKQRDSEPSDIEHAPVAKAMITAALKLNLYALAKTHRGCMVHLLRYHTFSSMRRQQRPRWVVEVRGGWRCGGRDEDFVTYSPLQAAQRFIELVGPWAAMNAIRSTMMEGHPHSRALQNEAIGGEDKDLSDD